MILAVHELYSQGLKQNITAIENSNVLSVRPHILKYGAPSGSLKMQLLDEDEKLIDESQTIAISAISSANYFHGYVRFDCNFRLKAETEYWIKLVGVGYSFSEAAYIGWCNDYDLRRYEASYTKNLGYYAALDYEIWNNKISSWE